jgi:hypothetical protein
MGGRRTCRCGGAGRRGHRPYRAAPGRNLVPVKIAGSRHVIYSRAAHNMGGACGRVALGRGRVRVDRLPAAYPLGPATRRFACACADRGAELRQVRRDGAISLPGDARVPVDPWTAPSAARSGAAAVSGLGDGPGYGDCRGGAASRLGAPGCCGQAGMGSAGAFGAAAACLRPRPAQGSGSGSGPSRRGSEQPGTVDDPARRDPGSLGGLLPGQLPSNEGQVRLHFHQPRQLPACAITGASAIRETQSLASPRARAPTPAPGWPSGPTAET